MIGRAGVLLVPVFLLLAAPSRGGEWRTEKGDHFIVFFSSSRNSSRSSGRKSSDDKRFAKKLLRKAEEYYKRIAEDLGYKRYSNFWTWDKRVKVYIYPDHKSYVKATGQPKWSKGVANYTDKIVAGYRWENEEAFLDGFLPHELGHLMFRDFIGFEGEVPLWLDEGVAQWQEKWKRALARLKAKELLEKGRLVSLKALIEIDTPRLYEETNKRKVNEFYIEAVSLVDFLITKHGKERFGDFCRQLRDGKDLNEALRFSYPRSIRSLEDLEKKWVEYVKGAKDEEKERVHSD